MLRDSGLVEINEANLDLHDRQKSFIKRRCSLLTYNVGAKLINCASIALVEW